MVAFTQSKKIYEISTSQTFFARTLCNFCHYANLVENELAEKLTSYCIKKTKKQLLHNRYETNILQLWNSNAKVANFNVKIVIFICFRFIPKFFQLFVDYCNFCKVEAKKLKLLVTLQDEKLFCNC